MHRRLMPPQRTALSCGAARCETDAHRSGATRAGSGVPRILVRKWTVSVTQLRVARVRCTPDRASVCSVWEDAEEGVVGHCQRSSRTAC